MIGVELIAIEIDGREVPLRSFPSATAASLWAIENEHLCGPRWRLEPLQERAVRLRRARTRVRTDAAREILQHAARGIRSLSDASGGDGDLLALASELERMMEDMCS